MNQQPAHAPQAHLASTQPPPDCGANPALHEPLPWSPGAFDASYFTCITPPYGTHAAPNFAACCDSPVSNFTTVHLTSEGPSACAAYCSVKPDRLLVNDYRSSDFHTCVFGGVEEDRDAQLECWDGEGFVGDLDWEDRFLQKRNAQENTDAPESTTTYNPSFWSSLISAAGTSEIGISLPTEGITPVATTPANGTAATTSGASLATGSSVSVSEISGTRTSSGASASSPTIGSSASATSAANSGSATSSASAATSSTSGAGAQYKIVYGKWVCTGLLLSVVFAALS